MWQLSQIYKPSSKQSLSSFLFTRLNFYLIDLFRQQNQLKDVILCENNSPTLTEQPTYFNEHDLRLQDIFKLLNQEKDYGSNYTLKDTSNLKLLKSCHYRFQRLN